jgi:hypothetical protein
MVAVVLWPPWGPTPIFEAYNNQQAYYATPLKLEKNIIIMFIS